MSARIESRNPATGEVIWEGEAAGSEAAAAAVLRARRALPGWAEHPLDKRVALLRRYAELLGERRDVLAELISRENGKPRWEALTEVAAMIGKVELSIQAQAERAGERREATAFGEAVLRHAPQGVLLVLGPFNFPGHLPNGHIVPALLAGNTVVFKPSELTPAVGAALVSALHDAGVPRDALVLVQGARETGIALADEDVDGLLFTGSAMAGAHLRRRFAERPRVILALELGGNNPLIAWDGDLQATASIAVASAFISTGQRCSCARRLIVPSDRADAVIEAIAQMADRLAIGAWDSEPVPFMGPLISEQAATHAQLQLSRLYDAGARMIRPLDIAGDLPRSFVRPAIVDVTGVDVPDEEIFGPVLQVVRVSNFDDAISSANASRFGLSAGLVSDDDALWNRFIRRARAGVINRNRPTTGASSGLPFGGVGESGNHRPSAYYAADYCAHPVATLEAARAVDQSEALFGLRA